MANELKSRDLGKSCIRAKSHPNRLINIAIVDDKYRYPCQKIIHIFRELSSFVTKYCDINMYVTTFRRRLVLRSGGYDP